MKEDEFLLQLYPKERKLYKYEIDGFPIYRLFRRELIARILKAQGEVVMDLKTKINKADSIKNVLISVWHMLKLTFGGRKASTVFIPFMRLDKVGMYYLDKFTDPFINICGKELGSYVLLDQGRGGVHLKPRLHHEQCLQTDLFVVFSRVYAKINKKKFYFTNQKVIDSLYDDIIEVYGSCMGMTRQSIAGMVCQKLKYTNLFHWLFGKLKAERIIFPTRRISEIFAAKKMGIKSFECQHGITYGETLIYGGYTPEVLKPDIFLAFGQNDPIDVYGIEQERIVNVGWAFGDYLSQAKSYVHYGEKDVLVISDPEITDSIIEVTILLATANPNSHFYVRPHPHEKISEEQKQRLERLQNCHWQDRNINIAIVLQGFNHVIGENSTVLYEALSVGKKVGKLFFDGLYPRYLKEEDQDCFWEIRSQESFCHFLNDERNAKKSKSIYSTFDKALFLKTIGIK